LLFLSSRLHVERLLWLHKHGLLYGRISLELLQQELFIAAHDAAVNLQYAAAAEYCTWANSPELQAAAAPLLLPVQEAKRWFGPQSATVVFNGRVLSACKAAAVHGAQQQLQQLERLQNLANLLDRIDLPHDTTGTHSGGFIAAHTLCSVPGAFAHRNRGSATAARAADAANASTTAAANTGTSAEPSTSAAPAASALAAAAIAAADDAAPGAEQASSNPAAVDQQLLRAQVAEFMAANAPYSLNAAYALELGDDLGVPVIQQKLRRFEECISSFSSTSNGSSVPGSASSSVLESAESIRRHLSAMCSIRQLAQQQEQLQLQDAADLLSQDHQCSCQGYPQQQQQQQQQQLQDSQQHSVRPEHQQHYQKEQGMQQQQCCGPAPLWQLALLAVLQATPNTSREVSPIVNMDSFLEYCMANEALPDALLQQLALDYQITRLPK
jgi:hypothetical protein